MPGTTVVTINDNQWSVSVASTPTELITGLSGIASILPGTGMLFILPARQLVTVDTTNMLFPIDIIFIKDNTVLDFASNIQPGNLVEEAIPIDMFLEVNALEAATVEIGDLVSIATIIQEPVTDWSSIMSFVMPLVMLGVVFGILGMLLGSDSSSNPKKLGSGNPGNPKGAVTLSVMKIPETGEYKIVWRQEGKVIEEKCYYTDDLEDAKATFTDILFRAQRSGYTVRIVGDKFIPDMFKELEEGKLPLGKEPPERLEALRKILATETVDEAIVLRKKYRVILLTPDDIEAIDRHLSSLQEKEHHSIHGEPRRRLVDKHGSWAVGRAEAICPEDDIACVDREAKRLIETLRSRYGETAMKYVTIIAAGKTVFHVGDTVSIIALERENERVRKLGETEATWQ